MAMRAGTEKPTEEWKGVSGAISGNGLGLAGYGFTSLEVESRECSFLFMVLPSHCLFRPKDPNFLIISGKGDDFTDEESKM